MISETSIQLIVPCNGQPKEISNNNYTLVEHIPNEDFIWDPKKIKFVFERDLFDSNTLLKEYYAQVAKRYEGKLCNANVLDFLLKDPDLISGLGMLSGTPKLFIATKYAIGGATAFRGYNHYSGRQDLLQNIVEFIGGDYEIKTYGVPSFVAVFAE